MLSGFSQFYAIKPSAANVRFKSASCASSSLHGFDNNPNNAVPNFHSENYRRDVRANFSSNGAVFNYSVHGENSADFRSAESDFGRQENFNRRNFPPAPQPPSSQEKPCLLCYSSGDPYRYACCSFHSIAACPFRVPPLPSWPSQVAGSRPEIGRAHV